MIEKQAYRRLLPLYEEWHPTVSAIAPLICFASVLLIVILLRLVTFFGAITAWCVETDEFWYTSTGGNWPLFGTFFLLLLLLFVWNVLIGFDDWGRSRGTRIMVVVNAIAIAAVFFVFSGIHDSATRFHNTRAGIYDSIKFQHWPFHRVTIENQCGTARQFSGRWQVVDRQIGYYGDDVPADWIQLNSWGFVYAQDASWSAPYAERWRPPFQSRFDWDDRWRPGRLFGVYWDFDLSGDSLVLTSAQGWSDFEPEPSRITLRRVPAPAAPVFPNPHGAY